MNKKANLESINSCFEKEIVANNIMPAYYIIEPTNFCNYKCIMCPNKDYLRDQQGYMNMALFRKIIDEIKDYAVFIQLYWMGEPFLASNLFKMIDYVSANSDAKIIISTNGSLLSDDMIKKVIRSKIYKLIVSLDAASSQKIYKKIRTGGNLQTVVKNVSSLLSSVKDTKIDLQFIDFNINKSEREKFNQIWKDRNCRLTYSWLNTWANQFSELKDKTYYSSPNSLKNRLPCSDLWYKMSIHWNGIVSICCYDWNSKVILGNLNNETVKSIWNSTLINQYRIYHKHLLCDNIQLCAACNEWAIPEEYNDILL